MTHDAMALRGSDQRSFFQDQHAPRLHKEVTEVTLYARLEAPLVSSRFQLLVEELVAAHQQEVEELQSALHGKRTSPSSLLVALDSKSRLS